jgi:hypothetical protein
MAFRLVCVRRRRSIQLRVHPDGALEVRGPWRCTLSEARSAIRHHEGWLRDTVERVRTAAAARPALTEGTRIPLLDEDLTLRLATGSRTAVRREGGEIRVSGPDLGETSVGAALARWYRQEARARLTARLRELAAPLGVAPARVVIRAQRTRWGSCSSRGTISLNWRLLLVPGELADYVLVHELCHLRHLSHSRAFWALVAGAIPDWAERRARLRTLQGSLPL